jgi:hypothetical protein
MSTPRRRRKDREVLTPVFGTSAIVPNATGDGANGPDTLPIEPTHDDIARRAYQLYEQRGGVHGHDLQDWFEAERELRQFLADVVSRILIAEGITPPPELLVASDRSQAPLPTRAQSVRSA